MQGLGLEWDVSVGYLKISQAEVKITIARFRFRLGCLSRLCKNITAFKSQANDFWIKTKHKGFKFGFLVGHRVSIKADTWVPGTRQSRQTIIPGPMWHPCFKN